jgi:hypothetical protein
MSDPPISPPPPRGRRWFVALAWVTMVLFGLFVALITLAAACLPLLKAGPR